MPSVTEEDLPSTPSTSPDTPRDTPQSQASSISRGSSFNFLLRDRQKSDKRLFRKRSKPIQHQGRAPQPKASETNVQHPPSFYKPKIVQDSSDAPLRSSPSLPPRQGSPPLSSPPLAPPVMSPSSMPASSSLTALKFKLNSRAPAGFSKSPRFQRSDSALLRKGSTSTHHGLRIEIPLIPGQTSRRVEEPKRDPAPSTPWFKDSSEASFPKHTPSTPLEIFPTSRSIPHGEHYFRTFGEDTVYVKRASSPGATAGLLTEPDTTTSQIETPRTALGHPSNEPGLQSKKMPARSSIFHALHRGPLSDSSLEALRHSLTDASPSPLGAARPRVSRPQLANSRHKRSISGSAISSFDNSISSYFRLGRRHMAQNVDQPVLTPSPRAPPWEGITGAGGHAPEYSEPLSPMTTAPNTARRHSPLEHREATTEAKGVDSLPTWIVASAPSTLAHASSHAHEQGYISSDRGGPKKPSLTGNEALSFLPSEMKRIDTPPLKEEDYKMLRGFRSFFFDSRSMPGEEESTESSPTALTRIQRRSVLLPKLSLNGLLPKLSFPRLKSRSSRVIDKPATLDPLEVTDFHQTPYSQRYGDARRAKMAQIRSYVDEVLGSNDYDSATKLPFELNVPDHLPSSPLCPLNARRNSTSPVLCPMHGRKGSQVKPTTRASTIRGRATRRDEPTRTSSHQPTIVFESGDQSHGGDGGFSEHFRNADREARRMA